MTLKTLFDSVNQWISIISDWTGVASFIASVIVAAFSIVKSASIFAEKKNQRLEYADEQWEILKRLNELRRYVIDSEKFTKTTVSDIRTEIYKAEHHFNRILNAEDKKRLRIARKSLSFDIQTIDVNALCDTFDYFIAKISRKL